MLKLTKETLANLTNEQLEQAKGGTVYGDTLHTMHYGCAMSYTCTC
jgi:hypothetical protein